MNMKRGLHYTVERLDTEVNKTSIKTDVPGYFCPSDVKATPTLAMMQKCVSPRRGVRGQAFDTGFLNRFV